MIQHTDEYWYEQMLKEDSSARPLTSTQKSIIIERSVQEAERQKARMEAEYGRQTAETYLNHLGFTIIWEEGELMPSFLYMGLLEPDERRVRMNHTVISLAEDYLRRYLPDEPQQLGKIREIVCFHELFHAIEECTEDIYTRNVRVGRRLLKLIPYQAAVDAASEIGAVHFSKIMSDVQFSPYLYTQYVRTAANIELEVKDGHR